MKKTKLVLIVSCLVIVLSLSLVLAACNDDQKKEYEHYIVDIDGVNVGYNGTVEKIFGAGTGVMRMLTYAGVEDKLVGIEATEQKDIKTLLNRPYSYINHEKFTALPTLGKGGGANPEIAFEEVIAAKPDVVFVSHIDQSMLKNIREKFAKFNIPVIKILIDTDIAHEKARENIRKSFNIIGKVCGVEERCTAIINKIDDTFNDLNERTVDIPDAEKPNCYIGAINYRGKHGLNYTYPNFSCLKAINTPTIALTNKEGVTPSEAFEIDSEALISGNPDYMFLDLVNKDKIKKDYNLKKDSYDKISAIKNNKVFSFFAYNAYSTNLELALATSYYFGTILYPEKFADINIKDKTNELSQFFLGVDYYDILEANNLEFQNIVLANL